MTQEDIIKVLSKNKKKEFTSAELKEFVECELASLRKVLRKLLDDPFFEIKRRELSLEEKKQKYGKVINSRIVVYWLEN